MSIAVLFMAVIGAIVAWWLSHQRLASKPWLEVGATDRFPGTGPSSRPNAAIGLGVLLAVVGALFTLLLSAYLMRLSLSDWRAPPAPSILWLNTGLLILSSGALLAAQSAARRGQIDNVRSGLLAAGLFALAFLFGQLLAWQQLNADGYFLSANPANAFFYLITGLHGLHVLGGLIALAQTADKAWRTSDAASVRLRVQLCGAYWHFLLALWLVLFVVLMQWVDDFASFCRQLLS